ncbi:MAG: ribonuclease J [Patescibacteria group bacterium]|nr:ribonuclease J [Patescibacteria group bacterium]MDE2172336.1 ribonuclease J [Patescibacteria group bacterium]
MNNDKPQPRRDKRPFHFRRRPYAGAGATRVLRTDSSHPMTTPISRPAADFRSAPAGNGHRIVLGRGARRHRGDGVVSPAAAGAAHVAGARMQVIRKENRPAKRGGPARSLTHTKNDDVIPPLAPDSIRIVPLGGVEEIGRNMTAIEFGDDIIVVDIGFQFKDENTPGIDYILPNTKYLEERQQKIRAVIITHGHLDHIGGIPYIMPRIGNPPLYTRLLTSVLIQKRQEEFPHVPKLDIQVVEKNSTITVGKLSVKFFAVTHTIPDAMGVIIKTPYGSIVHTGDLKLDHLDGKVMPEEEAEYDRAFKDEQVLLLMADSTNVENPGFSIPEKVVHKNIEEIIKTVKGRLIIATFSSLLERLLKIIDFAELYGKKVVVEGRSMKQNIEICKHLGLLKAKKETIITADDIDNYPPDRIIILATGAQGDEFAAMMRMSNKTHAKIRITPRDTVMLSSSIVPGNERAVQKLKDNLSRQGARIIHYRIADVHSSGHANRDETAWIHRKIHPKFFVPVHGYHYMLRVHGEIAKEANGLSDENIVIPDNSSIIEIQGGGAKIVRLKERAASGLVLVDGFSVGDVQDVVIRDRQMLAQDGIFIIFGIVNAGNGKLKKSPDIISRGFVYLRESQDLLHEVRLLIKDTVEKATRGQNPINVDFVKDAITDAVSKYLLQKTAKRPMVIPVILTI